MSGMEEGGGGGGCGEGGRGVFLQEFGVGGSADPMTAQTLFKTQSTKFCYLSNDITRNQAAVDHEHYFFSFEKYLDLLFFLAFIWFYFSFNLKITELKLKVKSSKNEMKCKKCEKLNENENKNQREKLKSLWQFWATIKDPVGRNIPI